MTKNEKQKLQNLFNTINEVRKQSDQAFKGLQDLNASLGNSRWCSAITNYNDIVKTTNDVNIKLKAELLIADYYEAEGKQNALMKLGETLAELNFWNKN